MIDYKQCRSGVPSRKRGRRSMPVTAAALLGMALLVPAPAAHASPTVTIESGALSDGGTVTCPDALARVVGGGYQITSSTHTSVGFPAGARSWTVDAPTEFQLEGTGYAVCVLGDTAVTVHSRPLTPGTATAITCPNDLAHALSGGFQADDPQLPLDVTRNHPSGVRSWTAEADAPGTGYVVCGVLALTHAVETAPLVNGQATVNCPNDIANVLGGGFTTNGQVPDSYPSGPRSWTVKAEATTTTGSAYAVCAIEP